MVRRALAEGCINKDGAIALKPCPVADFLGDALGGLENGMKVILLKQLDLAELQDVGMNGAAL